MKLFIDESGNTGVQRLLKNNWNFYEQPYFVLVGILMDDSNIELLKNQFNLLKENSNIRGEMKFNNKRHRKCLNYLLPKIQKNIKNNKGKIYIEIVNKKFDICKWIAEYCFNPYYDSKIEDTPKRKRINRDIANYIYEVLPKELLDEFLNIVDSDTYDVQLMVDYCNELLNEIRIEELRGCILETIDSLKNYSKLGLKPHNVFPVKDKLSGGNSIVSVSPNIDSYNNLIMRTLIQSNEIQIIHDQQQQFSPAINKWTSILNKKNKNANISIDFEDSKSEELIQMADYIAGFIRKYISNNNTKNEGLFKDFANSVNIVSTYKDFLKVFPEKIQYIKLYKQFSNFYLK